jgi:hypothetical protein
MPGKPVEPGAEWTPYPVPCGFCGKDDEGYAKQDKDGRWKPACWTCVKPKGKMANPVRKIAVESPPMEDLDTDDIIKPRSFPFDVPRINAEGMAFIRNRIAARKAGKKIDEPIIQENTDDSVSDSAVHPTRAKLAADKPATVRRRKVGTDGKR